MQNNKQYSSFTANIQTVLKNQANQLSLLSSMQQALISDNKYISYTYQDADGYEHTYTLPSYGMILNELEAVKQSINNLLTGQGTIRLGDKVCTIKVNQIASVPDDILITEDPSTFSLDTNWFFESLMFPGAVVTINLAGQVDNKTQQVEICRVILDAKNTDAEALWQSRLKNESLSYTDLIQTLNNNNIEYSEDVQTYTMPWIHNRYVGSFTVQSDPQKVNGDIWYYLNTLNYSTVSESGINQGANNVCLLQTSPSPRDRQKSRMASSA